jgi:hypothetical protein
MPTLTKAQAADRLRRSKLRGLITYQRHRGLAPADVFLASYPRSGNTWAKFMLAELLTGSEADFVSIEGVVPMVGRHRQAPRLLPDGGRLIKTHEPYQREYRRALYLVRDVRDVALSLQRFRAMQGFAVESREEFLTSFIRGEVTGYGSWQAHVKSWLAAADSSSNILVVQYERLIDDTVTQLRVIVQFLGISVDEARLRATVENNQPARMRRRKTQYSEERMAVTVREGAARGEHAVYSVSELATLGPAMEAMRQAGYVVEDGGVVRLRNTMERRNRSRGRTESGGYRGG